MIRILDHDQFRVKTERFLESAFGTPDGDKVILLEVGPADDFDMSHIRKAIHFTPEELEQAATEGRYSKAAEIVLYGPNEEVVLDSAQNLIRHGYTNLYFYPDGKFDWLKDGLWIQSSLVPADGFGIERAADADITDQPQRPELPVPLPEQMRAMRERRARPDDSRGGEDGADFRAHHKNIA
jgi:rhodanese-related sulfurtransferase